MTGSLSDAEVERLAEHLADARRQGRFARFPNASPRVSRRDAYRIQHRLRARLDGEAPPAGAKVSGLKKAGATGGLGVPGPFFASLPARSIYASGAAVPRALRPSGVECEIAVHIALGVDGEPRLAGVMAALELIERRYASISGEPLELHLADGLATRGAVVGRARPDWPSDLERRRARVWINDALAHEGRVGDTIDHPRAALDAFLAGGPAEGFSIRDGMILLTGNLSGEFWTRPGDVVRAEVEGLEAVETGCG